MVEHLGWAHFGIPPLAAWAVAVMEVVTAERSAHISMVFSRAPSAAQYNNTRPYIGHSSPPQHSHNGQHSTPKFSTQISAQTCGTEQHSTAQHSTAQHTTQHSTEPHGTVQHSTVQHSTDSKTFWGDESMALCHAIPVELVKKNVCQIYLSIQAKHATMCYEQRVQFLWVTCIHIQTYLDMCIHANVLPDMMSG